MKKNKMNFAFIFSVVIIFYLIIVMFIYFYQRKLLYHPSENNYLDQTNLNHVIERVSIKSDNDLVGWYYENNRKYKNEKSF